MTSTIDVGDAVIRQNRITLGNGAVPMQEFGISIGEGAGSATSGGRDTAIGRVALSAANRGSLAYNLAVGWAAGANLVDGRSNVFLGENAGGLSLLGNAGTSANFNCFVGYRAKGVDGDNQIAIGKDATCDQENEVTLGDGNIGSARVKVDWTITSDKRFKTNVLPCPMGLSLIEALTPVRYSWDNLALHKHRCRTAERRADITADTALTEEERAEALADLDAEEDPAKYAEESGKTWTGLLAQDVQATLEEHGCGAMGIVEVPGDPDNGGVYGIRYGLLVLPLINAVKELSARVAALEAA